MNNNLANNKLNININDKISYTEYTGDFDKFINKWNAIIARLYPTLDKSTKNYFIADFLNSAIGSMLDYNTSNDLNRLSRIATKNLAVFLIDALRRSNRKYPDIDQINNMNDLTKIFSEQQWTDTVYVSNQIGLQKVNMAVTQHYMNLRIQMEKFISLMPVNNNLDLKIGNIYCVNIPPKNNVSTPGGNCVFDAIFFNEIYNNNVELFVGVVIHEIFGHHLQQRARIKKGLAFYDGLIYEEYIAELIMLWMLQFQDLVNIVNPGNNINIISSDSVIDYHCKRIKAVGSYNTYYARLGRFLDSLGTMTVENLNRTNGFEQIKTCIIDLSNAVENRQFFDHQITHKLFRSY